MIFIIEVLILYAGLITIRYSKLKETNKINYSNYQSCLKVIADMDPTLAEYLKNRGN